MDAALRMGGLQWQRDFTLRSDLVTQPMPVVNGSAAVPSTVDIFVNNIKAFSQDVGPGPYQIVNLPVVCRDRASGRHRRDRPASADRPSLLQ
jgi:outer membrane usher protein